MSNQSIDKIIYLESSFDKFLVELINLPYRCQGDYLGQIWVILSHYDLDKKEVCLGLSPKFIPQASMKFFDWRSLRLEKLSWSHMQQQQPLRSCLQQDAWWPHLTWPSYRGLSLHGARDANIFWFLCYWRVTRSISWSRIRIQNEWLWRRFVPCPGAGSEWGEMQILYTDDNRIFAAYVVHSCWAIYMSLKYFAVYIGTV